MKTKEEIIQEGYAEDWASECSKCHSWNCHKYADGIIVCFDCKTKEKVIVPIKKEAISDGKN